MEKVHSILENIKTEFEVIESVKMCEDLPDDKKLYNETIAFYTYSKQYEEMCYVAELIYIAYRLGISGFDKFYANIYYPQGEIIKLLKYKDYIDIDINDLNQLILEKIKVFKHDNKRIIFLNRVTWSFPPRIYMGRFYCRRRLAIGSIGLLG